jgi:branched-chain amino acid transport system substrate-binding protein
MKTLKFTLIFSLILILLGNFFLGCKKEPKTIKIGAILPLTGSGAFWGENAKKGIDLAVEEINSKGGVKHKKLEVIYEDSQTLPKFAVSALRKLISAEKIQACIVDMVSSNVLAMAPVANENRVVIISPGASNPDITKAGPYVFRNWPSDALQGVIGAKFAYNELGWRKVAILYIKNAYGEGLKDVFTKHFQEMGGEIIIAETFEQGASDFRSQISKLKELGKKVDGIYLLAYPAEHPIILKQIREAGIPHNILATETFDDPAIVEKAKRAAEGVIFSVPAPPPEDEEAVKNFRENFMKKYGEEPGLTAPEAYDALKLLALCIEKVGYNGSRIQQELLKIKKYPGAAGETTFDENGDVIKPFIYKVVKNGKIVRYNDKIYWP